MYTVAGSIDKKHYLEKHAPLVKRIAHHMMSRLPASVQVGDLIQAGLIGLMDAVSRYEEAQGVQFEAYASQRIRGAMIDELRVNDWFPRSVRKNQRTLDQALGRLEQKLGRAPNETEVAAELGVSLEQYREMLADAHGFQLVFFEDSNRDDDDSDYMERHGPVERDDPFKKLTDARFKKALVAAIEGLPEREKLLMGLYYDKELNFKEIAAVLGVTESRVCQLHSQAVSRLRGKLKGWKPE
jgi:RNA polymerase sigma factor for flagellar operon FliA